MALPEPLDPVFVGDPLPAALNEERTAINDLTIEVENRVILPANVDTGSMMRWDGTKWARTLTRFFEGNGNPNGQVAAPVGSRYVNRTPTRGEVEWVKSGGGDTNQGWTTSAGQLSPQGQHGTTQISGAAAKTKTRSVALDSDIFLGAAPSQVFLTAVGTSADIAHPYLISKGANTFSLGVRNLDNVNFTAAAVLSVEWFAII